MFAFLAASAIAFPTAVAKTFAPFASQFAIVSLNAS